MKIVKKINNNNDDKIKNCGGQRLLPRVNAATSICLKMLRKTLEALLVQGFGRI